jgi:membrane-bound lytic murein transglycosylase B
MRLFVIVYFSLTIAPAWASNVFTNEQEEKFVKAYSVKYNIPKEYMKTVLEQATYQPHSDQLKQPSIKSVAAMSSQKSWEHYRKQFIHLAMINKGAQFMCTHLDAIHKATNDHGVPPEVILGIIGVETAYGDNVGHDKVLDVLATIAFNSHRRLDFFQDELAKYILICYKNGWDPAHVHGSIDGAFGIPQFMPSSYLDYAISYTNDTPNLMVADDAIISIANYIKQHGWKKGEAVYLDVKSPSTTCQKLSCNNHTLTYNISTWMQNGILVKGSSVVSPSSMAGLVSFGNLANHPAWLVLNNFFAIFAYNHSNRYALTTYQLGSAVVTRANQLGCK